MPGDSRVLHTIEVLGGLRVRHARQFVRLLPSASGLIALLAVHGPQERNEAAARLWPDHPHSRALSNLRTVLWRVRRSDSDLIDESGGGLTITEPADVDLDQVRRWCARSLGNDGSLWPLPAKLGKALLPAMDCEWLIEPREGTLMTQLHALEAAAARAMHSGHFGEAVETALIAANMDPLRESATRLLIETHLREGNPIDAGRRYELFAARLRKEVGAAPSPALGALVAGVPRLLGPARVRQGRR